MKVYIQSTKEKMPHNNNFFSAYQGFSEMGWETVLFHSTEELAGSAKNDVVVGYVEVVRERLSSFGITSPEMDYPEELTRFLGRKIWKTKMSRISDNPDLWPIFVKPVEDKKFTGIVVRSTTDLVGCGAFGEDPEVYCSEIVDFKSEWRVFVRYGKILGVKHYRGDWRCHYDASVIEAAVAAFENAPGGYAIDFGVTSDGRTLMIEVNDGYALGSYGLNHIDYAKLLSARWAELTDTYDEAAFDV